MAVQKKMTAFIYLVCNLQWRQDPITYTNWTQKQLVMSVREMEVDISCTKVNPVEIKVGKVNVGWGWDDWKENFIIKIVSKKVLMGYVANISSVRSSLKDEFQHTMPRLIKRDICTWYRSMVPGTSLITVLYVTRSRAAALGPRRTIGSVVLKQVKISGPRGWRCSINMKKPTWKTSAFF